MKKLICQSFKIDENEISNQDEKLKEEIGKVFLDNFSALVLHTNRSLKIELEAGTVPKRSKSGSKSLGRNKVSVYQEKYHFL